MVHTHTEKLYINTIKYSLNYEKIIKIPMNSHNDLGYNHY